MFLHRSDYAQFNKRSEDAVMITRHHQRAGFNAAGATRTLMILAAGLACMAIPRSSFANEIDGFTEPCKTIDVAAAETGTIKSIDVREGDVVEKGQVLARLDDDVHQALLAIAAEAMSTQGQLKSAEAEVGMRRQRLRKLEVLRASGNARQEEVERARADVAIAAARVLSAKELLKIKHLEYNKVRVQLNRRAIRAPIDGVVSFVHKEQGEFVAPNDPHIVQLVCLDPLMASFNVPSYLVSSMKVDQKVSVYLDDAEKWVEGDVAVIAPVTEAESSTVRVKVRIPNGQRKYRSGEHCTLQLKSSRVSKGRQVRP